MREDVFVRLISLPPPVKGVTLPNPDGTYSVYINSCLSFELQQKALKHELCHIEHDHLYSNEPVAAAERLAGGHVMALPIEPIKPPVITLEGYFEQGLMFMSVEEFKQRKQAAGRRFLARRSVAQQRLSSGYIRNRDGHIVCLDIWK